MSHPTWVRGLKPTLLYVSSLHTKVAPYVGAWIETDTLKNMLPSYVVAPYVGAWIETYEVFLRYPGSKSHPTWVRGLKLLRFADTRQ